MKTLILAAGYATRLYPLTQHTPKPLLKIRKRPIIDYIIDKIDQISRHSERSKKSLLSRHSERSEESQNNQILIISNHRFYAQFNVWLYPKLRKHPNRFQLFNDGSISPKDKLGAIGDMNLVINDGKIDDDLLVIAGDNLFDFDLTDFIDFAMLNKPYHSICLYSANEYTDLTKFGIADLNGSCEIISFEEKPDFPKTNLLGTCIYFIPKEKLSLVSEYIKYGNNKDTPGSYINWLVKYDKVYGKICEGMWFDLGDFDSLTEALIKFNGNGKVIAQK